MQIVITRENVAIPWGFRLKGGAEYNVPLSILKVNDGSPSYRKLEVGDVIASIGSYSALNLNHEDALNIIRQFDLNLPLVIQREQSQFGGYQNTTQKLTAKSSAVWRPPSVSSYDLGSSNSSASSYYQQSNNLLGTLPSSARNNSSSFFNDQNQIQLTRHQFQNQMYQPQQVTSTQSPSSYNQFNHSPVSPHQNVQSPSYKSFQSTNNSFNNGYEAQNYSQPLIIQPIQASPPAPPPPPAYIPPPPPPMNPLSSSQQNKSWSSNSDLKPVSTSFERKNESIGNFKSETSGNAVPDALLKSMHGSGKKPFTYTPGGLDLSHVKNSLRVKRHEQQSSTHQFHHQQQQPYKPQQNVYNFNSQQAQQNYSTQSNFNTPSYISNTNSSYKGPISNFGGGSDEEIQYSPPISLPSPSPSHQPTYQSHAPAPIRLNSTSSSTTLGASSYKPINFDSVPSTPKATRPPITYQPSKTQAPSVIYQGSALNITPDQLVKPKGEDKRELMNQSFSFRMLNKWIEDSESKIIPMKSKKDEEDEKEKEKEKTLSKKSEVIKALEEEEIKNRSFNSPNTLRHASSTSQLKSVSINPAHTVPSKVFQYVDRKYSITEDETNQANYVSNRKQSFSEEQYQRMPARERTQENAPPKYKGAHIPSKAFSYLQYLTQNETNVSSTNTNNSASSFSNLLPASQINAPSNLEFASLQVFEAPNESENKKNNLKINATNNASFPNLNNDIKSQNSIFEGNSIMYVKKNAIDDDNIICDSSSTVKNVQVANPQDTELDQASAEVNQDLETTSLILDENKPDNNFSILPKSASFVETLPSKETDPCFNEPNIALSFSNNETINESVDLNNIKEAGSVKDIEASKLSENEFKFTQETEQTSTSSVFEKKEEISQNLVHEQMNNDIIEINKSNGNENQVSENAQEIETSEF